HDETLDERALIASLEDIGFEAKPRGEDAGRRISVARPLLAPLAVAGFAAMNVMLLSVSVWSGAEGSTRDLFHWLSAAIALPAIGYSGRPFFSSAWKVLRRGRTNMDVPISIGIVVASALSFYEVLRGGEHAWFDAALMLIAFLLAGRVLDAMMRDRARAGVDALLGQAARGGLVIRKSGALEWVEAAGLARGDLLR